MQFEWCCSKAYALLITVFFLSILFDYLFHLSSSYYCLVYLILRTSENIVSRLFVPFSGMYLSPNNNYYDSNSNCSNLVRVTIRSLNQIHIFCLFSSVNLANIFLAEEKNRSNGERRCTTFFLLVCLLKRHR